MPAGTKRILRLLPRLQPVSSPGHARLLHLVAELQPAVAAEFVSSLPYHLEPAVRGRGKGVRGRRWMGRGGRHLTPGIAAEFVSSLPYHLEPAVRRGGGGGGRGAEPAASRHQRWGRGEEAQGGSCVWPARMGLRT